MLAVINGTGSGSYAADAVVSIVANTPPAGQIFDQWTGATVASPMSATTTLIMPAVDTTVTATFKTADCPVGNIPAPVQNVDLGLIPQLRAAENALKLILITEPDNAQITINSEYRSLDYQRYFWNLRVKFDDLAKLDGIHPTPQTAYPQLEITPTSPYLGCQDLVDDLNLVIWNIRIVWNGSRTSLNVSNPDLDSHNSSHTEGRAFDATITVVVNGTRVVLNRAGATPEDNARICTLAARAGLWRPYGTDDRVHFELCPNSPCHQCF